MENTAPPMTAPPMSNQPPRPSWWKRNWKWFVPLMVVTLCGGPLLIIFTAMGAAFGLMKSSEPYKEAVTRANANPQVEAAMGTPVKTGFMVSGNVNLNNDAGTATLDIPVTGPKGKGSIHVQGDKAGGTWTYSAMDVTVDGKPDKIPLLAPTPAVEEH